MARPQGETRHS